ncbi:hypothetical protein [Gloeocapsa sp. PCC 73106]|uniref:hypothetical protein n=1 Tax=Gloeocapsa sp. PCC 73106 TaxID=102232 RepID=UPI0002AC4464|nr:hypothetical protein [Gloeocapsa sp. PCC 73106]ELR96569.1 hypothetical protein GLO73106DRAFT_00003640 [Gloeocapsa sp. PCC 73106]
MANLTELEILIRHNLLPLPLAKGLNCSQQVVATLINNISYYGYALSEAAYQRLITSSEVEITAWWSPVVATLKKVTGDDKNMGDFVVYKNFPQEVLRMSEVEYWTRQILMYWGFPNDYFTEPEAERLQLGDKPNFRVLHLAQSNSLELIFEELIYLPVRWTDQQWNDLVYLLDQFISKVDPENILFKENLVKFLIYCLRKKYPVNLTSATDVLRLAVGLSEGDISLKTSSKFRNFKRRERKILLNLLNKVKNLDEDIVRDKNRWKKLMYALHPGDYHESYPLVVEAYNRLYQDLKIPTFNSNLEQLLAAKDTQALQLLKTRPGEFVRRLRNCLELFGLQAKEAFVEIIPQLKMMQLLKLQSYLETINYRIYRTIPPSGNWTKMQVIKVESDWRLDEEIVGEILQAIAEEMKTRIQVIVPSVHLDPLVARIKLQNNDSDLTPYGRGTIFPIPENIRFIRTASYWRSGATTHNIWYDNGWNFFDQEWVPLGSCCWTTINFYDAAVFSGDPTNSKEGEGNACQLIDLYLDRLLEANVRYAVWNILCFSHLSFDEADDVFAALQWGENPERGNLFEPSRCQFAFPIKGKNLTKYIALIDLYRNELVYLDANLYGMITAASYNLQILQKNMPPFLEYIETLPSVFDLFKHQPHDENGLCVAYSDQNLTLNNQLAYIFRPENRDNQFKSFSLSQLLNL